MKLIESNFYEFTEKLCQNAPITCNEKGAWYEEGQFSHFVRKIFHLEDRRLIKIAKAFENILDQWEKKPVLFYGSSSTDFIQAIQFEPCLKAAEALLSKLRKGTSKEIQQQSDCLAYKIAGLKYRIGSVHGGNDPQDFDPSLFEKILPIASRWKARQTLFVDKLLSVRDAEKIKEACRYPQFAELLLHEQSLQNEKSLQTKFFKWIIRDNNGCSEFIEFPDTTDKIKTAMLASRIGRFGGSQFSIQFKKISDAENAPFEKIICLPFFDGRNVSQISLLDENKIVNFNGGLALTIGKILKIFRNKKIEPGNLEYFGPVGIMNWNYHELGWWDAEKKAYQRIDITLDSWWKNLPIFELCTKEQVESRFQLSLQPGEWVASVKATVETLELELQDSHGYIGIAIPQENGLYAIYDFGKYAEKFPQTTVEVLTFLVATVCGKIAYPDENAYYSHRRHAEFPFILKPEEGERLMQQLRVELRRSLKGRIIFQLGCENCAYWSQSLMQSLFLEKVPNLFKLSALKSRPSDPLVGKIFSLLRKAPKSWQKPLLKSFDTALGSFRGRIVIERGKKVFKSMALSPHREAQVLFLPAYLHRKIVKGSIKGILRSGH